MSLTGVRESPDFCGQKRHQMTNEQTVVTLDEIGIEEMDQVIAPGIIVGD